MDEGCGCFPTGRHYAGIAGIGASALPVGALATEIAAATPWRDLPLAMLDVETTGLDPERDRILEVGVAIIAGGVVRESRSWLVQPGIPVPEASRAVHGITDEELASAPLFEHIADEILEMVGDRIPAAYNARFDRGFLHAAMRRTERMVGADEERPPFLRDRLVWIDPLVWVRHLISIEYMPAGELGKARGLSKVAEFLDVPATTAHRAAEDAETASKVLLALPKMPTNYGDLVRVQMRQEARQDVESAGWRRS